MQELTLGTPSLFGLPLFSDWFSIMSFMLAVIGAVSIFNTGFKLFMKRLIARKILEFWNHTSWDVYIPKYNDNKARIEDVLAVHEIKDFLHKINLFNEVVFDDKDSSLKNNIYVCGFFANKKSKNLADSYSIAYEFHQDDNGKPYLLEKSTNNKFYSPMDNSNKKQDIALIGQIIDESKESRHLICWGIHGVGTYGAAKYLCSAEFVNEFYIYKDKSFLFLVCVEFSGTNTITHVSKYSSPLLGNKIYG